MKTVEFTSRELRDYFIENYPYISLELNDSDLYYFTIGLPSNSSLEMAADRLSDYILANGLGEVQE